jgi:hypothetical protein
MKGRILIMKFQILRIKVLDLLDSIAKKESRGYSKQIIT